MTHQEIQEGQLIERYVRHQLAPAERRDLQEHLFACEECFEQAQTTARFIASVRQAARQGALPAPVEVSRWAKIFRPAFGLALAAILILFMALGWFLFRQPSPQRPQLANEPQSTPTPEPPAPPAPKTAQETPPAPEPNGPKKAPEPRDLIAENRPPEEAPGKVPVVLLESSRDVGAGSNRLTLPAEAGSAILRVEMEPGSPYTGFQFQVFDSARRLVATASGGRASARGVVSARLPAQALQTGTYLVKGYGLKDGQRQLIGEYDLRVSRP